MPVKKTSVATPDTTAYVKSASLGSQFEIAAARLARQRSTNSEVKDFAQLVINDESAISDGLKAAIWQANIDIAVPSTLDEKHAAMLRDLKNADANDFDRRYMQQQILVQDDTARAHMFYGDNGDNRLLREFANETGPKVEADLVLARHLALTTGTMQAGE
jgi:putative membrane protein